MALRSDLFRGDPKLEAAAVSDSDHILPGARGPHVVKIQQALNQVAGAALEPDGVYGSATAAAVADFKRKYQPPILNYQGKIDDIVGIKTTAALDAGLLMRRGHLRLNFNVDPSLDPTEMMLSAFRAIGPFAAPPPALGWVADARQPKLQARLRKDPRFLHLKVALVDLTAGLQYSGWNDTQMGFAASTLKIAPMLAAFRLRERVRKAAALVPTFLLPSDDRLKPDALVAALEVAWRPAVDATVSGGAKDFPKLTTVFNITFAGGGFSVQFKEAFDNDMTQMIISSSDPAAARCIRALGFQYINGVMATEGFFTPAGGGLWLGGDYSGHEWKAAKVPGGETTQGATALEVARFMTHLHRGELVSPAASDEMLALLIRSNPINGIFLTGLRAHRRPPAEGASKIGYARGSAEKKVVFSDAGRFRRSQGTKMLTYVAVGLSAPSEARLVELILALDDLVVASN